MIWAPLLYSSPEKYNKAPPIVPHGQFPEIRRSRSRIPAIHRFSPSGPFLDRFSTRYIVFRDSGAENIIFRYFARLRSESFHLE
jgi:hypothetical protein